MSTKVYNLDFFSTFYNMHSVTSNAVAQSFEWELFTSQQALDYFGFQFKSGYSGVISINTFVKCKNLIIMFIALNNVSGSNIGTDITASIGTTNIRPKGIATNYGITGIAIDYKKSSAQVRFGIASDGTFLIPESVGVTNGSNALRSCLVIPI